MYSNNKLNIEIKTDQCIFVLIVRILLNICSFCNLTKISKRWGIMFLSKFYNVPSFKLTLFLSTVCNPYCNKSGFILSCYILASSVTVLLKTIMIVIKATKLRCTYELQYLSQVLCTISLPLEHNSYSTYLYHTISAVYR